MRKVSVVVLLVLTCLALAASPAAAQKDPFEPVIDPNAPTTTTTGTATTTGGSTVVQPSVGSQSFPNTGADVTPWLAIAYGLLAIGTGAIFVARMYQPHPTRR